MRKAKGQDSKQASLEPPPERSYGQHRLALKKKVRMFYDLQRLRLQVSGRLYRRPAGSTIDLHEYDVQVLNRRADELKAAEASALDDVKAHLKTIPFYVQVLSDKTVYKGLGPTMAAVVLSEFDIARENTASQMWAFSGLAPLPAHRCRKCHAVVVQADKGYAHEKAAKDCTAFLGESEVYSSGKAMRPTKGERLPYNAFLKTKLVGVLGSVLLQVNSPWRKCYDDYKHRKQSANWGRSDAHRHQAAIRYMVKMLLLKIWQDWRAFEGLSVRPSYHEEKLGHSHSVAAPASALPESAPSGLDAEVAAEVALLEAAS